MQGIITIVSDFVWTYILIALLIGLGVYFTIRMRFVQFSLFKDSVRLLGAGTASGSGVSSFGAFAVGTAARVGTGNLAGVALAIAVGGPGAIFWMWMIALVGAASAFVESTLAQVYKVRDGENFRGGPAYYMERALGQRWMGILFAVLITFTFGLVFTSVQANTITLAFEEAYGFNRLLVGIVITIVAALVIFGGIRRIARVAQILVVVMAIPYVVMALYVVVVNFTEIPRVFGLIVGNAFGIGPAVGGGFGAAIMQGVRRGLFSNEAGMGSAPNAAATADVSHPAKQGLVQSFGVFVDTIVICSATAFVILFSGIYESAEESGITLTQQALESQIGGWSVGFISFAVFMFAFSSIVANYYYGETNIEFITGSRRWITYYRVAVMALILFGAVAELQTVWTLADLFMASLAIVNLIAIFLLAPVASAVLKDYRRQRDAGQDPVFKASNVMKVKNTECWGEERRVK